MTDNAIGQYAAAFADVARLYAATRPTYPASFFEALAARSSGIECAWDCGTGNGQAARGLSAIFKSVEASDSSAEQIAQAPMLPGVRFRVAPAEASGLPDQSIDLISVAQAFHWFNRAAFYAEVRRVARPGALLALYGYSWFYLSPELDELTNRWLLEPVESYWNPNNRLLWDGYRTVDFPFAEVASPRLAIHLSWTLDQLFDYYLTWSATRRKIVVEGDAFVTAARGAFDAVWKEARRPMPVVMPMCARFGRL